MRSVTLTILNGPLKGAQATVFSGMAMSVGRVKTADFAVMDPAMSRKHFQLQCVREQCLIRDLASRNGTKLNERVVVDKELIRDGDEIVAGCTVFLVRFDDLEAGDGPPFVPAPQTDVDGESTRRTWELDD